jgi:hypothetical protein
MICTSAFSQCLQSSHQAVCCHLGPHEVELEKNPTLTASQLKMRMTPKLSGRRGVVIPASCLLPPLTS